MTAVNPNIRRIFMNIRKWGLGFICALVSWGLLAGPGFAQPPGKGEGKFLGKSGQALERAGEKRGQFGEEFEENRERLKEGEKQQRGKALGHFKKKRGKGHFKSKKGVGDMDMDQERARERIQSGQESMKGQLESGKQKGLAGAVSGANQAQDAVKEAPKPQVGQPVLPSVKGGVLDKVEPAPAESPKKNLEGFLGGLKK